MAYIKGYTPSQVIDNMFLDLVRENEELRAEIETLKKEKGELQDASFKAAQSLSARTLIMALSGALTSPSPEALEACGYKRPLPKPKPPKDL